MWGGGNVSIVQSSLVMLNRTTRGVVVILVLIRGVSAHLGLVRHLVNQQLGFQKAKNVATIALE